MVWPAGQRFKKGDVCKGVVSDVFDFGVFVDLGGCVGFVNPSEIAWRGYPEIAEVMYEGREVNSLVIGHAPAREHVLLSIKGLEEDPIKKFSREKFGVPVMGSVAMVVAGGLHVSLPGGVSGLLPESAMIGVADKYRVGDEICVEVARINLYDRQIELSLGTRT
ncbi:S1 RNA-binding domain-containing protein [Streptomyces sp. NPDC059698]|uniref:S1 RNA-binding domain-containing protein n=2 Tax=Streptomyces TaxID=1883 RepID=UPI001F5BF4BE|nr:S1 RNA-binding domain-containing protein [Streptomyces sp. CB02366]WSS58512.1 S1 RNA-binding domain-containing protein [Streptomyces sp. NBC_01178]